MPLGSWTATRSPGDRPRSAYPAATRSSAASSSPQLSRRSPATTAGASGRCRAEARTSADSVVPSDTGLSCRWSASATRPDDGRSETGGVAWTDCSDVVTMGLAPQHARRSSGPGATGGAAGGLGGPTRRSNARMPSPRPLDAARQDTAAPAAADGRPTPYPRPRPSPRPRPTPFPRGTEAVPAPRPELSPDGPVEADVVPEPGPNVVVDPALDPALDEEVEEEIAA